MINLSYPIRLMEDEAKSLRSQALDIGDDDFKRGTLARAAACEFLAKIGKMYAEFERPDTEQESILENRH